MHFSARESLSISAAPKKNQRVNVETSHLHNKQNHKRNIIKESWCYMFVTLHCSFPVASPPPSNPHPTLHFEKALFGIAPHLYSLQGHRTQSRNVTRLKCGPSVSCSVSPALYLLAHADLHDGKVDESLPQVSVLLLLEVSHVHQGLLNVLPAREPTRQRSHTRTTNYDFVEVKYICFSVFREISIKRTRRKYILILFN